MGFIQGSGVKSAGGGVGITGFKDIVPKIKTKEAHGERDADLREHRAYCPGLTVHATAESFGLQRRLLYHKPSACIDFTPF